MCHVRARTSSYLGNLVRKEEWDDDDIERAVEMVQMFQQLWLGALGHISKVGGKYKKFHFLVHLFELIPWFGAMIHTGTILSEWGTVGGSLPKQYHIFT